MKSRKYLIELELNEEFECSEIVIAETLENHFLEKGEKVVVSEVLK